MVTEIFLQKVGETMDEGKIVRWLKTKGERVKKGDIVCEIETDKSVFEVEAEGDGIIVEIFVKEGQTVPVGTTLGYIAEPEEEIPVNPLVKNN